MIKSLSQLKRTLKAGDQIEIVAHCCQEYTGTLRRITLANTQGFYSMTVGRVDKTTTANEGKGSVLWWSKAPFWSFENGLCSIYNSDKLHDADHLILSFRLLDKQATNTYTQGMNEIG